MDDPRSQTVPLAVTKVFHFSSNLTWTWTGTGTGTGLPVCWELALYDEYDLSLLCVWGKLVRRLALRADC